MEPQLGLATTRQLLEEIRARGEVSAPAIAPAVYGYYMVSQATTMLKSLPDRVLDYRTVEETDL